MFIQLFFSVCVEVWVAFLRRIFLRVRWTLCCPSSPVRERDIACVTRSWRLWVHVTVMIPAAQRKRGWMCRVVDVLQTNSSLQQTLQALQSELDSLRADNIKLYEKIKFLQSYPNRVSRLTSRFCGWWINLDISALRWTFQHWGEVVCSSCGA